MSSKKEQELEQAEIAAVENGGPGVARIKIPEIDSLARKYQKLKEKRCAITPSEVAAKTELLQAVHAHANEIGRDGEGVIRYYAGDLVVEVTPGKDKLKVKSDSDDEGMDD